MLARIRERVKWRAGNILQLVRDLRYEVGSKDDGLVNKACMHLGWDERYSSLKTSVPSSTVNCSAMACAISSCTAKYILHLAVESPSPKIAS